MKVNLPLIGQVKTGKDAVEAIKVVKTKKKSAAELLGGILQGVSSKLSDEKTVSTKVLESLRGWVYINNDVIAKEVGTIDFQLYRIDLKGGEVEYTEVDEHPLLDLLDRFNDTTTKSDAIYNTQSHKKLTGDSFWLLEGANVRTGDIDNIFLLPPDKIELDIGDPTDGSPSLISGYKYKDVIDGEKVERYYTPDEVLHLKSPNPKNMFRGLGVVEAAAHTIDLDFITEDVTRKFFDNGAITNFVLSTENKITDEQLKRLKAELKSAYSGKNNAYQTMILGGGLKPENITMTNKEMEFLAQLEWYRDKIMIMFGNTKASLGIIDDVNRASHESAVIAWKRGTIRSEMESIVNSLNEFLVPRYGEKLVLGFADPVPEDRSSKIEEASKLKNAGIITVDEAREMLDLDPRGGDADKLPIEQPKETPAPLKYVNLKQVFRRYGLYSVIKTQQEIKLKAHEAARVIIKSRKKKVEPVVTEQHGFDEETLVKYWTKQISVVEVHEKRFYNKVEQFITSVRDKALANLDDEVAGKRKALFNTSLEKNKAHIDFRPLLIEQAIISGQEALKLIGEDSPYLPLDIRRQIERNIDKFATSMLDTEKELLNALITEGIKDGKSVPQIRQSIVMAFEDFTKVQAERVTRSEVIRVSNQAAVDAWKQSGVVEGKQWLTAQDGRVDADCAFYNGKILGLSGTYTKTEYGAVKEPPLHPNCRCVVIPVVAGLKNNEIPKRFKRSKPKTGGE